MAAGIKLSHEEASKRFAAAGYVLSSDYECQAKKVDAYCLEHEETHKVFPLNIFKGQRLKCCGNHGRSVKHTGKVLSEETKAKLSAIRGDKHSRFGVKLSEEAKKKVSESLKLAASFSVDYPILKASTGKTAGKPGFFYIAKVGDNLKFGSVVRMQPHKRMEGLREEYSSSVELLLLAQVPDAGAYEAMMMDRHRDYWVKGELFRDFRDQAYA